MENQLVTSGTIIGLVPGADDFVILHDGSFEVHCYVPDKKDIRVGQAYNVYKQNGTYCLGTLIAN